MAVRRGINELIPGKLYQRGQMLTWPRADKAQILQELRIRAVVQLWPKLDAELGDAELDWYFYVPCPHSNQVFERRVLLAANAVAHYLTSNPQAAALIQCEAGKTRSVFFSILVVHRVLGLSLSDAADYVFARVPGHALSPDMLAYVRHTLVPVEVAERSA